MKAKAHVIGGVGTAAALLIYLNYKDIPFPYRSFDLITGSFFGSLLPDIDHKKSMLGSIVHLKVKHRTLTHSLAFLFFVSVLTFQYNESLAIGLFLGIFSHLLLDMAPKKSSGICLFYPSKKRYSFFHLP